MCHLKRPHIVIKNTKQYMQICIEYCTEIAHVIVKNVMYIVTRQRGHMFCTSGIYFCP